MGTSGGVPWFKLRPRALSRTVDSQGAVSPPDAGVEANPPSAAIVLWTALTGLALLIGAAVLFSFFPLGAVIAGILGAVLAVLALLAWRDRRASRPGS